MKPFVLFSVLCVGCIVVLFNVRSELGNDGGDRVEELTVGDWDPNNKPIFDGQNGDVAALLWRVVDYNPQIKRDVWRWPEGIPKATWGPAAWYWLHTFAIAYPKHPSFEDAKNAQIRLWDLAIHLPCGECANHAKTYLGMNPPVLTDTTSLQMWAFNFHNFVNHRKGKPQFTLQQYLSKYAEEMCQRRWMPGCP